MPNQSTFSNTPSRRTFCLDLATLFPAMLLLPAGAIAQQEKGAEFIRARKSVADELGKRSSASAVRVESTESAGALRGSVQAVSNFSFEKMAAALSRPKVWCEMMMLNVTTVGCRTEAATAGTQLSLAIGRRPDSELRDSYPLIFAWRVLESTTRYMEIELDAPEGPMGTTDHAISFKAAQLRDGVCFVEFDYACRFGASARLAMQTYLSTLGRNKVGFSRVRTANGEQAVGGLRGAIERTTMRYFLAVEAWLQASSFPADQQFERRLQNWFTATQRYPRQLHELDWPSYSQRKVRDAKQSN